jgi:CBS-domain-containing membrane protein
MDCKTMMAPIKTCLFADEPAGTAIDFMVEKHMGLVPVTERDGTFAGLISGDGLMHGLLPKSISTFSRGKSAIKSASYLDETAEEMRERFEVVRENAIGDMVDRNVKTVRPDTPLIDALMLITSKQYVVPVVDENNQLLGAISFFSVLYGLREDFDREKVEQAKHIEREERQQNKDKTQQDPDQ